MACATSKQKAEHIKTEEEYRASFEETWRAVQQSIITYPLKANNMDIGQIQTSTIRGSNQFNPPHIENSKSANGHRYTITINVLKLSSKKTKVSIIKESMVYRDFISDPEDKSTDGLEEMILLYRIGREIEIEKMLSKGKKK